MIKETGDIFKIIREHFPQFTEVQLQEEIAKAGEIMNFRRGDVILDFGNYIKLVPLVIKGGIKVYRENENGTELFLYYLEKGQACSMSFTCCMMNKKSIIRMQAEEDCTIIGIPIRYMDIWMRNFQSWKNFVMISYNDRISALVETIDSIAFQKMDERLLNYLQKKSTATSSNILQSTHQEIAADLNASREAVSRLLKQLENLGEVKLGRNKVELL